jgi:hypothetical protein
MHVYICGLFRQQTKVLAANWSEGCAPSETNLGLSLRFCLNYFFGQQLSSIEDFIFFVSSTKFPTIYLDYATNNIASQIKGDDWLKRTRNVGSHSLQGTPHARIGSGLIRVRARKLTYT